jgi:hypothetical protein
VFGGRRGWTIRQRIRAADSYGLLLPLIIASLFATALSDSTLGEIVAIVLQGGALLFALYTSRAKPNVQLAVAILVIATAIVPLLASSTDSRAGLAIGSSVRLVLALAALTAILRRLTQHLTVNGETLMGALSMYLLLGLLFAAAFGLIGALGSGPFFAGRSGNGSWADRLYFSFTTLATVGYGDFTAASDLGRMCAISEALIGQLYLVSVVALIVTNLGRTRRPREIEPPR